MADIQREQPVGSVALGQDHQRSVRQPNPLILVPLYEVAGPANVSELAAGELPRSSGQLPQCCELRLDAAAYGQQVVDLGQDIRGDDERAGFSVQSGPFEEAGIVHVWMSRGLG